MTDGVPGDDDAKKDHSHPYVELDDYRQHLVVPGIKLDHVMPAKLIHKLIYGDVDITDVDDYQDFLPTILSEWFASVERVSK